MLAQNTFVRIRSRTYGEDARVIERSLREALGVLDDRFQSDILIVLGRASQYAGAVAELLENLPEAPEERREEFEKRIRLLKKHLVAACVGQRPFGGHFNNYLKNEFTKNPEFLDKLMDLVPRGRVARWSTAAAGTVRTSGTSPRPLQASVRRPCWRSCSHMATNRWCWISRRTTWTII